MQPGLGGPERDTQGIRHLGQRHPQEVVHATIARFRVEAPERLVEQVAIDEGGREVGWRRRLDRGQLDLDRATSPTADEVETGVDGQPVKPGVETIGVAEARQVAPGPDESLLDGVTRELRVPEDQSSRRVQPREPRVDELGEGVMIASLGPLDGVSLVHGRLGFGAAEVVALRWYGVLVARKVQSYAGSTGTPAPRPGFP